MVDNNAVDSSKEQSALPQEDATNSTSTSTTTPVKIDPHAMLVYEFSQALKTILNLDSSESYVDAVEMAKVTRSIPVTVVDLASVLDIVIENAYQVPSP
jgi:hypothetical protein